ncbi:LamG-like jellyroll fold domain-containing protein [Microbacterium sp.]|uniref:LamG-like jellyroll fold domain-containing protein n=1 Tax=Microbacterium sp. TaxID=51671 RepID=UPI003A8F2A1C
MFFRFPIGAIAGKQILNAVLGTTLTSVAACPAGPISSHYINYSSVPNPGFTWNQEQAMMASGQMSWSGTMQSWTGPSGCGTTVQSVGWTVTAAISSQTALSKSTVDIAFAGDNNRSRKHFAKAATLTVSYNTPPSTPTGAKFSSPDRACGTAAAPAMIGQNDVTVVVDQRDPDGGNVDTNFVLAAAANLSASLQTGTGGLGAQGLKSTTFHGLTDGVTYAWRARGSDWIIDGTGFSPWCYFTVDTTAPAGPTLSSTATSYTVGSPVAVSAAGAADVAGYVFWTVPGAKTSAIPPVPVDGVLSKTAALPPCSTPTQNVRRACASGGTPVDLSVAPTDSLSTLWVSAYDGAGNQSPAVGFALYADSNTDTPAAPADLDAGHAWQVAAMTSPLPAAIPDSNPWIGAAGIDLNLPPTASKTSTDLPDPPVESPVIYTAVANAADEPYTTTAPIDTSKSFTLSMWVKAMSSSSTYSQVIAVQPGVDSSTVQLRLTTTGNYAFCFGYDNATSDSTALDSNCAVGGAVSGDWQLVTGIWDSANQQLRLLVGNEITPVGSASHVPSFTTTGSSSLIFGPAPDSLRFIGYIANPVAVPGVVDHHQLSLLNGFFLPFS